jgi:hypothetical protein
MDGRSEDQLGFTLFVEIQRTGFSGLWFRWQTGINGE